MKLELTRVHMVGPAGSGKTCAQQLLLNEPPPTKSATSSDPHSDVRSATSSPPAKSTTEAQSSGLTLATKHTTDSTPIACKAVKALRIASHDGTETWNKITEDKLLEKLAASLKEAKENAAAQQIQPLLNKLKDAKKEAQETQEEHLNSGNEEQIDSEPNSKHSSSDSRKSEDSKESKQEETPQGDNDAGDVLKDIADLIPKAGAQLSEKWVYIVDSGGQPAFQELLPLFTRAATLNVITLDISKDLDEKFEFMYRFDGQNFPCDRGMKHTNRKVFNSVVSSASVQKPIDIPFVKHQPKHSMSFVLGTHYDVLIEKNKNNKEAAKAEVAKMSDDLMSAVPHLTKRIPSVHKTSVIYPVNTLQKDERMQSSKNILETMSKFTEVTIEIEVPVRCFAFELSLEKKAEGKGFVTREEAIEEGKKLYMKEKDVEIALTFLHTSTIILYYPQIEVEPKLVFVDPQKIIDVLSHLLALTYVSYPIPATKLVPKIDNTEICDLKEGYFTKDLLEKFPKVFSDKFTSEYFISLLKHLDIVTHKAWVRAGDNNSIDDNIYFIPVALPAYNDEYDNDLPKSIKPLYYVWTEEGESKSKNFVFVPQGIFILIFVHLLKKEEIEFRQDHSMYRDTFSLRIYIKGKRCTLYIINRYRHIEVYFNGPKNYCPQVRKLITTTINTISSEQHYKNAFPCPNGNKQCYCIVNEEYKVANCSKCDLNDISESDESYWCWFNSSSGAEKAEYNGIEPDKTKKDDQKPPVVSSEFFPEIKDFEDDKKMKRTFSTQLIKEEQEFIEKVNVILVTATKNEYRAVMGATDPPEHDGKYIKVIIKEESEKAFILGKYGLHNVAVIMTGQGPKETDKVLTSIRKIVKAKYVIAIGICYGAKEGKTKLGDIIVAESIVDTQNKREEKDTIILADTYHCGEKLVNIFKHDKDFGYEADKSVEVHVGVLVSEFTLHRNEEEKQKILKYVPKALGGEMEANGIHRVADRERGFEWIVIKSIVDWGNEDKNKDWQPFAAVLCARFVLKYFNDPVREGDLLKEQ
ncbi:PREDICTED: uncharacterized protein LOC109588463 [Amphimedon queenslandica]|uniref:Nucleoside phosphorylase domain-containing protein n=1 Tax=Amphimedon queenslandica TaxID=400682 RepID=A0AAN0JT21_AMPQE|nr:PREDICTED: uncharacterized protein LOC109588463 [Amphimedon queenslandica]|eukprot:XP_019860190.1 PREDICTED: uncharacterized protein LOC109588463 [Amphimedon queenslandica]